MSWDRGRDVRHSFARIAEDQIVWGKCDMHAAAWYVMRLGPLPQMPTSKQPPHCIRDRKSAAQPLSPSSEIISLLRVVAAHISSESALEARVTVAAGADSEGGGVAPQRGRGESALPTLHEARLPGREKLLQPRRQGHLRLARGARDHEHTAVDALVVPARRLEQQQPLERQLPRARRAGATARLEEQPLLRLKNKPVLLVHFDAKLRAQHDRAAL
eukprot:134635-Pleurochrysis_carterae.AAC.2